MKLFPLIPKPKDTFYTLLAGLAFLCLAVSVQIAGYFQSKADPGMQGHHFLGHGLLWGFAMLCAYPTVLGGLVKFLRTPRGEKDEFPRLTATNRTLVWSCCIILILEHLPAVTQMIRMAGK